MSVLPWEGAGVKGQLQPQGTSHQDRPWKNVSGTVMSNAEGPVLLLLTWHEACAPSPRVSLQPLLLWPLPKSPKTGSAQPSCPRLVGARTV